MIEAASPRESENEMSERMRSVPFGEGYSFEMFSAFSMLQLRGIVAQIVQRMDADETRNRLSFTSPLIRANPGLSVPVFG